MPYPIPGPPAVQAQFKVISEGLPAAYCTKATVPRAKPSLTDVQPAGVAQKIRFPSGLAEYDDLEMTMIIDAAGSVDAWTDAWLKQLTSPETGQTGVAPEAAKRVVTVQQLSADGETVIAEYQCNGCILKEPGNVRLEGGKPDAVTVDMKFSVDYTTKVR